MTISSITSSGLWTTGLNRSLKSSGNLTETLQQLSQTALAAITDIRRVQGSNEDAPVGRVELLEILDTADEELTEAERILLRMQEIAELSASGQTSQKQREALEEEFQELVERLNELSDSSEYLNGTFGGVDGAKGVAAMGIDRMESTGDIKGDAKFNITHKDGKLAITLRIDGKTVTNVLGNKDRETTFKLGEGKSITLGFSGGVGSLMTGAISGVEFKMNQTEAVLDQARSADRYPKELYARLGGAVSVIEMPNMPDISAPGLKLQNTSVASMSSARSSIGLIKDALRTVGKSREGIAELRDTLLQGTHAARAASAPGTKVVNQSNMAAAMMAQTNLMNISQTLSLLTK